MVQKWDVKAHEYKPYVLPDGCFMYSLDMDAPVSCAQCGNTFTFGECYTSREVHNKLGLGFPVCEGCYAKEVERVSESEEKLK